MATAPTAPPTATAVPPVPDRTDRATFSARAVAIFDYVKNSMWADMTAFAGNAYANALSAYSSAQAAGTSEINAAASATAASATAGALAWVNGGTYALNSAAISQIDFQTYRKKTASSVTTVDPKNDSPNWVCLGVSATWLIKTTGYTAVDGDCIQANTTSAAFPLTLPATPAANAVIRIADYAGTFGTNNLTVARNGSNIMGLAEDMTVSTNNVSLTLAYIDATQGWRIV